MNQTDITGDSLRVGCLLSRVNLILRHVTSVVVLVLLLFGSAAAQSAREITLGVATSLTFLEGRESFLAVKLAVDEINANGGVRVGNERLPLRIESVDLCDASSQMPVSEALTRLKRFLTEKKPHVIIVGPYRSEVFLSAMEILADHKIPLIGNIALSSITETKILRSERYKYIFRIGLNTQYLVEYLINTMKFFRATYGFKKVYIMVQDVAWAKTTASQVVKLYFDQSDWQVIGVESYAPDAMDFTASLTSARRHNADIIMPFFDHPESGNLVKQWKSMKIQSLLFGFISPLVGPGAWQRFDEQIAEALTVIFELGNIPAKRWKPATTFFNAFKKKYGKDIEAGHGPAPAYESVYVFAEAIERAACLDSEKLVAALESTDRTGTMGRIRFHRGHQVIFGNDPASTVLACIVQWQSDGRRKIIYPLSIADGSIEKPPHVSF